MAEYLAMDAASASLLHVLATKTPMHAYAYMTEPREDTKALILGEATHYAILEPDLFDLRYAEPPDVDGRTVAGKAAWSEWKAAHPQCVPMKMGDYLSAKRMQQAVLAHAEALRFLQGPGINETTLAWHDDATGEPCKARPDRICVVDGWTWVVDLKTCRSASPFMFAKAIAEYGYHNKAAWYLDALALRDPRPRRFLFAAVESEPPHALALYELTDEALEQGRAENRQALALLALCKRNKEWPGYDTAIQYVDLPRWKQKEMVTA
jgi:hypothetical protein